jgi:CBS domain-containing protein
MMKIRNIMRPTWSIRADDSLWRAERIMARRRNKHLPVVDAGKLVGIISERDVVAYRAASAEGAEWWLTPVRDIMREVPMTAGADEPASVAAERIAASPDAVVPVIENDFLIGVVTARDLLDAELGSWATPPATTATITAADVMTEAPITVGPADSLIDATRLMSDHQIRHLPVVENGIVVGMLSERDLLPIADELSSPSQARQGADILKVRDAMTSQVTAVLPDASLSEVSRTLIDHRIGAVPVVDGNRRPIGIISYVDVLGALAA